MFGWGDIAKEAGITALTGGIGGVANALGIGKSSSAPKTPKTYTLPNGTTSPYDPSNNYGDSGMSYDAYSAKYGSPAQQAGAGSAAGAAGYKAGNNAANNPAINPTLTPPAPTTQAPPTYGSESGPGLLDQWFNERATGTDPGFEYAMKRATTGLNNQFAARGGFNSGAATQGLGDMYANMATQREGQLDALAGGASGERNQTLATMLGLGTGLAGAQAGLGGTYDVTGANAMSGANNAGLQYGAQSAMIPYLANQGMMQNMFGLGSLAALA